MNDRGAARRDAGRPAPPDGLVIVDKPAGWTSHDVVARMRRLAGTRRVGHAGTLDPMATGVLVLGLEKATRLLGHLALTRKVYQATIRLGQSTLTDDAEGEVTAAAPVAHLDDAAVLAAIGPLTGEIMQVPSSVSAIKVNGVRSYARVRSGDEVKLAARPVTVYEFTVHRTRRVPAGAAMAAAEVFDLDVTVACSSGTYIRALARDLGAALGVGGHLTALRRTLVGPYGLAQAHTLEELAEAVERGEPLPVLSLAAAAAAAFPRYDVDGGQAQTIAHGGFLPSPGLGGGPIAVFGPDGAFLALVEERGDRARPIAVFA
ncbi:tRNA pseudouridine(55) synthase TruB [Actinocrinis puniceicyclus]|uniref:tRNA pseudouridine synthase B n=1 Tax=Actinocrinis puniceicyclus TaxID=977794 RepID=A0A8J8BDQ5_9ACTN|nr:tRNA pseudouridine(55) synthase TruB [Actinocrinis puniceicyclus]MBS2966487.1 tRNA pseudouridine(55) synthase TruB [Actinocrinis puniceicyclus]